MNKITQAQLQERSMPESDEKRPNDQFDVPWKDILDAYLPDFLEFFLPVAFAEIDWNRGFEFLNTEFGNYSITAGKK